MAPAKSDLALEQLLGFKQMISHLFIFLLCGWCGLAPAHATLHSSALTTPVKSTDFRAYFRDPYHNPKTGRFWTQDSYEGNGFDPASLHKYTYCHNNPVNRFDPSGHISLTETMETINTWVINFAIQAPRAFKFIAFAAEALVPAEVAVALPGGAAFGGTSIFATYLAAKELQSMRWLFELKGGFAKLGTDFERWVGGVLNISKSNLRVIDGGVAQGVNSGYAVIDYIYKGSILEVKLSGSALKEQQAKELAKYAQQNDLGLTYIFMNAPSKAELDTLRGWVKEVAPSIEVRHNFMYP